MKTKNIEKVLLLVAITILLVSLASAATINKTSTNKNTKIIKDNTKNIKTTPVTTKKASTKTITNNKTQTNNKVKQITQEKTTQKIEKNKQKNTKTETETISVTNWTNLTDEIGKVTRDVTIKLEEGSYNTTDTITLNNPGITVTIDGNGQIINGTQNSVFLIYKRSTLHLKNITIINAQVKSLTGNNAIAEGGAIHNLGNLTITHSTLQDNTATAMARGEDAIAIARGGAIYNLGNLTITHSTLENNQVNANTTGKNARTSAEGGAIYNSGNLTITNSTLQNNTATEKSTTKEQNVPDDAEGGAIYNSGNLTITHSTLENNQVNANTTGENTHTSAEGGAIYNIGNFKIIHTTLKNNTANATGDNAYYNGGAIYTSKNYNNFTDTIFYKNTPINFIINETTKNIELVNNENYISIGKFSIIADGKEIGTGTKKKDLKSVKISDEYKNVEIIINGTDGKTLNNRYMLRGFSIDVHNYTELVNAIKEAQSEDYDSFRINLKERDYNATDSIDWRVSETKNLIINGNNITLDGKHEYQFIRIGSELNLTLKNITITNYNLRGTGDNAKADGGAIDNRGNLTITYSTLTNNTATTTGYNAYSNGGAIYNTGNLTIAHSTLNNNTANTTSTGQSAIPNALGGAIYNEEGNLNITHSTLNNNTAKATATGQAASAFANGGAIFNEGNLTITFSTLNNNTVNITTTATGEFAIINAWGGAIQNSEGNITINNSVFTNNQATATGQYATITVWGGAIHISTGTLTVRDSTFINNQATATGENAEVYGGAIINSYSKDNFIITHSTFINNQAITGGAIYIYLYNNYDITDSTFYKNTPVNFIINETTENIELVNKDNYISIGNFTIKADGKENRTSTTENDLKQFKISDDYNNVEILINGTDSKTLNNRYILRISNVEVHNYSELVKEIETAKTEKYNNYIINLLEGDYNATQNIIWKDSATKNLIINGNGLTLDGKGRNQFILVGSGQNLTLNNLTIINYTAKNGGAIESYGNLTIINSNLSYNTATEHGGAIYIQGSNDAQVACEIVGNHFEGNRAKDESIYLNSTLTATIKDNTTKIQV